MWLQLMAADPGRFEDSYEDEDEDGEDEADHGQTAANGNAS
jgi:hypothetical protein